MRLVIVDEDGNVHEVSSDVEAYFQETYDPVDDDDYGVDVADLVHDVRVTIEQIKQK